MILPEFLACSPFISPVNGVQVCSYPVGHPAGLLPDFRAVEESVILPLEEDVEAGVEHGVGRLAESQPARVLVVHVQSEGGRRGRGESG